MVGDGDAGIGADDGNDGNEEKAKQGHDKLPINNGGLIPKCSDCYNIYFPVYWRG